jgi:pimeloyl-ACP methyl ester carboxylesterase
VENPTNEPEFALPTSMPFHEKLFVTHVNANGWEDCDMTRRIRWRATALAAVLAMAAGAGWAVAGGMPESAAIALVGDAGLAGPEGGAPEARSNGLARFYRQRIEWKACQERADDAVGASLDEAGARCARVTVPVDYRRPGGRTLTVAIARIAASDQAGRVGPLIINLGGPAVSPLPLLPDARAAMGATGAKFDLIAMDPRFVGRSTPIDCGWPQSWLPRSAGADRESFNRAAALARDLAARCVRTHGDVLPHASTDNIARDMDVIRGALGDRKLSYLGYSQGTYLGSVYMQMFPQRAGRMVLDSAIDPTRPGFDVLRGNAPARAAALREWAALVARFDDTFHLGATTEAVLSTVDRVYRVAAERPLRVGRHLVDDTAIAPLFSGGLVSDSEETAAELATTAGLLARAANGETVEPSESLEATLTGMLTGEGSAFRSQQTALMCGTAGQNRNAEWYWRDIQAHRAAGPLFEPQSRNITPCAFWPAPAERPTRVANGVPALIVNAAGDIDALLPMGQAMHRALTGSRMITLDGVREHMVYLLRGVACVDDAVNAYLSTGQLPATDTTCTE